MTVFEHNFFQKKKRKARKQPLATGTDGEDNCIVIFRRKSMAESTFTQTQFPLHFLQQASSSPQPLH